MSGHQITSDDSFLFGETINLNFLNESENIMQKKYKDIETGDVFGNWLIIDANNYQQKKGYKKILCECQCVNKTKKYVDERNLKNGSFIGEMEDNYD